MPCAIGVNVIVCGPPRGMCRQVHRNCWTCETDTDQIERWDGAWYGVTFYCLTCLDIWQDGCRMRRPFKRYWRRERQADFQAMWDNACPADIYEDYTRADAAMTCANDGSWEQFAEQRDAAMQRLQAHREAS